MNLLIENRGKAIYNLPEPTDNFKDKSFFTKLCKSVFDTTVKITKSLDLVKNLKIRTDPSSLVWKTS